MMLNFDQLKLRYRLYPIGLIRPAMPADVYAECLSSFPEAELFEYVGDIGHKLSLSEKNASKKYEDLIKRVPVWRSFHRWIKSQAFIESTFDALSRCDVDLGYEKPTFNRRLQRRANSIWRGRGRGVQRYSSRFEFSMLPAAGGAVIPHTDNPEKVITIVISMLGEGEWSQEYGGGTDVLQPRDESLTFDYLNDRRPKYEDLEILHTFPFESNQAVIFAKTFNSLHGVRAMTGPDSGLMRRSLTINIEAR